MQGSLFILDGFYNNPEEVRQFALNQEFGVSGNYPGVRTKPFFTQELIDIIQRHVEPFGGKITHWVPDEYNGAFQYTTSYNRSWIHADQTTKWAGVCYLTPNAPLSGGTGLFRHKETGLESAPKNEDGTYNQELLNYVGKDSQDMTKWELTAMVGNKFNRLVLYRGDFFHMSLDYFGTDLYTGRLFQTFFFDTEF